MLYERDDSLSRAARIISERIRALPEFAEARGLVVLAATTECRGKSVSELRELGGFSEVVRRHISALGEKYRVNHGSKMWPFSVVDELKLGVPAMREAVQIGCSVGCPHFPMVCSPGTCPDSGNRYPNEDPDSYLGYDGK